MIVICPYCRTSLDTGPGVLWVECTGCKEKIHLSALGTTPGLHVPPDRDLAGRTFGKYKLEELIGIGGMGVVYRARDEAGEAVAVKILYYAAGDNETIQKRFDREIEILESLEHPNIVRLVDRGRQDNYMYIVMEYVPGSLAERLRSSPLSAQEIMRIVDDVTGALAFAHEKKIIHRDLKPTNILLSSGSAKISDFGIAHVEYDRDATSLTQTAAVLGTFNYMSPEQRMGEKDIDRRADVYALGVLLYELFTGRVPIGSFPKVSSLRKDATAGVDAVIEKALSQDRAERYDDVSALRRELAGALTNGRRRVRGVFWIAAAGVLLVAAFYLVGQHLPGTSMGGEDGGVTTQAAAEGPAGTANNDSDPGKAGTDQPQPAAAEERKNVAMTAGNDVAEQEEKADQPEGKVGAMDNKPAAFQPQGKGEVKQGLDTVPDTGTFVAATTPSADLWIDGKKTGRRTPITTKDPITLNAGSHKVSFVLPTGEGFHYTVKIRPGKQTKLVKNLEKMLEGKKGKDAQAPKIKKKGKAAVDKGKKSMPDDLLSEPSSNTK